MDNPYLLPQEETVEALEPEDATANADANASGGRRHVIRGLNGEELPEEVQAELGRYYSWNNSEANSKLPKEFKAVQGLYEFFSNFSTFQQDGTLLAAVAEVLNDMTGGDLNRVYRLRDAERRIMWTQSIIRLENVLMSIMTVAGVNEDSLYATELAMYFEVMLDVIKWYKECAVATYLEVCEDLGREPDHAFIESGVLSERTHYQKVAMGYPIAKKDI